MAQDGKWPVAAGLSLSVIAVAACVGAGAGTRLGWWDFHLGIKVLTWGAYLGVAGVALSGWAAVRARPGAGGRGFAAAIAGIVLGVVAFGVPANAYRIAMRVPMIHDVTTDTENPPAFVSILALRKDAPNPAQYGGPEIAARQRAAYPDIRPVDVGIPPPRAYEYAFDTARKMGWRIVDGNLAEGRIEATAATRWFGFKDDVVIRIVPTAGNGSRLDIRSVSRVGISDLGANACRIRAFVKRFAVASKAAGRESPG